MTIADLFQSLDYESFISRFPGLKAKDPTTEASYRLVVEQIIIGCKNEIDLVTWGDLALEGLLNLVACKLSQQTIADMLLSASQIELALLTKELENSTSDGINISEAQKITIEDEYSIEFKSSSSSSSTSGNNGLISSLTKIKSCYYCQEFDRLQDLVGISLIYSHE